MSAPPSGFETLHGHRALERARLAAEMGKWSTALALLGEGGEAAGCEPEAWSLWGLCVARTGGDLEAARDACRRAIDAEPYAAQHHARLGEVYAALGLVPLASEFRRAALRLDPTEPTASAALVTRVRAARARRWLRRALRRLHPRPA
jgi:tetratricopeptide (TPR) repeat protein